MPMFSQLLQHFNPSASKQTNKATDKGGADEISLSKSDTHNALILQHLAGDLPFESYATQLRELFPSDATNANEISDNADELLLILARYNTALTYYCSNQLSEARELLVSFKEKLISSEAPARDESVKFDPLSYYRANALFLFLDCSIPFIVEDSSIMEEVDLVLGYLEEFIDIVDCGEQQTSGSNNNNTMSDIIAGAMSEMKFRLHLYKTKILLFRENESESIMQKQSKKEIKSALEMYQQWKQQQKNPRNTETSSCNSTSNFFYDDSAICNGRMNQCALLLKANLELLKSNPRKAMKLCNEARAVAERTREKDENENTPSRQHTVDEIQYFNNIGCLHFSSGKVFSALYHYNKALELLAELGDTKISGDKVTCFTEDGRACPIPMCEILHNTALCALQAKKFVYSYECMSKCIQASSSLFARKAKCWLHMAEGCIGLHLQKKHTTYDRRSDLTESKIGSPFVMNDLMCANRKQNEELPFVIPGVLGSEEDILQLLRAPLQRALFCLSNALHLCTFNSKDQDQNEGVIMHDNEEAIRILVAYVRLELGDPVVALNMAKSVLLNRSHNDPPTAISTKRKALAKLYACEALCCIGNAPAALQMILKSNMDSISDSEQRDPPADPLEKLVDDMSWRMDKCDARALVNVALGATFAVNGDLGKAENHAKVALAVNLKSVKARNALLFCLLRRGDTVGALNILRMAR